MISPVTFRRIQNNIPSFTALNIVTAFFAFALIYDGAEYINNKRKRIQSTKSNSYDSNECSNIVRNGNFEEGISHWDFVGSNTGLRLIAADSLTKNDISSTSDGQKIRSTTSVLATIHREQHYDGMSQELNLKCMSPLKYYEVSLDVMILDDSNDKPLSCEPFQYYFLPTIACPSLALKLHTPENELITIPIARSVGPWNSHGWNAMYGIFQASLDLFEQNKVELYVTDAPVGTNEVISNVVIQPVHPKTIGLRTCAKDLIRNGDAEIEDARFWYLKGGGEAGDFGTLDIVSTVTEPSLIPDFSMNMPQSRFAFFHYGTRDQWWNGMWQKLDQDCMGVSSVWKVRYHIQLLDPNHEGLWCDKHNKGDRKCPAGTIESVTLGKEKEITELTNEVTDLWKTGEWNLFEATFVMTSEHKELDETWFYISSVKMGNGYIVDNISITPVSY